MRELNELNERQDLEEDLLQLQDIPPVPVPAPDYLAQFKRKPKKGAWPWMKSFFMAQEFVYVIEEDAELKRLEGSRRRWVCEPLESDGHMSDESVQGREMIWEESLIHTEATGHVARSER